MRIILLTIIYINSSIASYSEDLYISGFNSVLNFNEYKDPIVQEYVQDLSKKLTKNTNLQNKIIKTNVPSEYNKINAFTIFNKFIVIYPELIRVLNSESQLSAIIAHELSHIFYNHYYTTVQEISGSRIKGIGSIIASIAAGIASNNTDVFMGTFYTSLSAIKSSDLKNSRTKEEQADLKAIDLLQNIGAGPSDLIEAFNILDHYAPKNIGHSANIIPEEYNSTHPHLSTRIKLISKYKKKKHNKHDQLSFNLIQARLGKKDFKGKIEVKYVEALNYIKGDKYNSAERILISLPYNKNWIILATLIECWEKQKKFSNIINIDNNKSYESDTVKLYQAKAYINKGEYLKARRNSGLNIFKINNNFETNYRWFELAAQLAGAVTNDDYFMYFMGLYNFNKGNFKTSKLQFEKAKSSNLLSPEQLKDLVHNLKVIKEFI